MLDFDVGKLVVIGVVALIVIGPKDLPRVLRQVGNAVGKMRRMAAEFQGQFMEAMREADVENLKKEVESAADLAKVDVAFDPVRDVKEQITSAVEGDAAPGPSAPAEASSAETHEIASLELEELPPPPEKLAVEAAFADTPPLEAPKIEPAPVETKIEPLPAEPEKLAEKRA